MSFALPCKTSGSNNYLTSVCVFVFVCPFYLVLQSAAFYGGSGKSLEDAASRIPTVKKEVKTSVTELRSNTVNGI
jgi:hypothetical protein